MAVLLRHPQELAVLVRGFVARGVRQLLERGIKVIHCCFGLQRLDQKEIQNSEGGGGGGLGIVMRRRPPTTP
jgi:hypothetical protein